MATKSLGLLTLCLFILLLVIVGGWVGTSFADVDTFEGETGTDTWEGSSNVDTREGSTVASGGECSSGTACTAEYCVQDEQNAGWGTTYGNPLGQTFEIDEDGQKLYSVIFQSSFYSSSGTGTIRIGTSSDLSSTYDEATVTVTDESDYEAVFTTHNITLNSSTTYYIGFEVTSGSWRYRFQNIDNPYAHGYMYQSNTGWSNVTTSGPITTQDVYFTIKLCDP